MRLAAAPISWGVCEVPGWGYQLSVARVLEEAARLGLREIEAGPPGFLPADARAARELMQERRMRVIGGFVTAVLHDRDAVDAGLREVERNAAWLGDVGADMLVLAAASGRDGYDAPVELAEGEWQTLLAALPRAAQIARAHGLGIALHPHFGTAIETARSIDRVIAESDVPLCLDTGHIYLGGGDAVAIARGHASRVRHVHLKDADASLAAAVRERRIGYADAVARGLFRPLGDGGARIGDVLAELVRARYDGWAVLEQDIALKTRPSDEHAPERQIARSRDFARSRIASYDVLTMGRVSVDLYPEQIGVPLAQVSTFAKSLGGSATNVAVAASRLGRRAAVITKVGADGFGDYVRDALKGFGVDASYVGTDQRYRTPLVFCEIHPPDRFPLLFYREPTAPDMTLAVDELPHDAIRDAQLFWTTGTGLSAEPSRRATIEALELARGIRVHDLDHRPALWPAGEDASRWAMEAARRARVVIGNVDEMEMATGQRDPSRAASALLALGPEIVVVKRGLEGATAFTVEGAVTVPGIKVEVVCGLGAGDAFGGALAHGVLAKWHLPHALAFANAAGAIVASRLACADAMPTSPEVEALLARANVAASA
jgi:5-dehydro-2-deoxygluconokinase